MRIQRKRKKTVLKHASLLCNEFIKICEKEYDQSFKSKGKNWRLKHDYRPD